MTSATVNPILIDAKSAAKALGVSPRTLWSLTRDQKIRAVRIGARVLYPLTELDSFVSRSLKTSNSN